jgi:hypothetical protein
MYVLLARRIPAHDVGVKCAGLMRKCWRSTGTPVLPCPSAPPGNENASLREIASRRQQAIIGIKSSMPKSIG